MLKLFNFGIINNVKIITIFKMFSYLRDVEKSQIICYNIKNKYNI